MSFGGDPFMIIATFHAERHPISGQNGMVLRRTAWKVVFDHETARVSPSEPGWGAVRGRVRDTAVRESGSSRKGRSEPFGLKNWLCGRAGPLRRSRSG